MRLQPLDDTPRFKAQYPPAVRDLLDLLARTVILAQDMLENEADTAREHLENTSLANVMTRVNDNARAYEDRHADVLTMHLANAELARQLIALLYDTI